MNPKRLIQYLLSAGIILLVLVIIGAFFLPWRLVNWGTFAWRPASTVTVVGEAKQEVQNKKATFSVGVNVVKDKKEQAIDEANQKITAITEAVKNFGIPAPDIKTQNISIYQEEESYTEAGRQKQRLGQWRVNTSIEIVLRDVGKASGLTDVLSKSGANSIYGPNFTQEDNPEGNNALLSTAISDARKKAYILAKAAGKTLGAIITLSEGTTLQERSMQFEGGGVGGGSDMQPGSETVRKTVTVTFSLQEATFIETLVKQLIPKK
ncbi:MAG: SIMPL domain-containing protein [Parcubacteria group bacterium]